MIETILVQINNNKAYKILADLEDLRIIKILKKSVQPVQKLSKKYGEELPASIADQLEQYCLHSRNEWNHTIPDGY